MHKRCFSKMFSGTDDLRDDFSYRVSAIYPVSTLWISCAQRLSDYLSFHFFTLSVPDEGYSRNSPCDAH